MKHESSNPTIDFQQNMLFLEEKPGVKMKITEENSTRTKGKGVAGRVGWKMLKVWLQRTAQRSPKK